MSKEEIQKEATILYERYFNRKEIEDDRTNKEKQSLQKICTTEVLVRECRRTIQNKQSSRVSPAEKKQIEGVLINYFPNHSLNQILNDLFKENAKGDQCGGESCVWFINDGNDVLKVINPYYYLRNEDIRQGDVLDFVQDKILLYNEIFSDTPYCLEGFDKVKTWDDIDEKFKMGFKVIVTQPLVRGISLQMIFENFKKIKASDAFSEEFEKLHINQNRFDYIKSLSKEYNSEKEFKSGINNLIIKDLNIRTGERFKKVCGVGNYESDNLVINDLHGNNIFLGEDEKGCITFKYIDANPMIKQ